ncbi:hypothetical protein BHM03_00028316 [Ensete ventricosum]|nr:hypothetical protein BHM03_00028316 [Ensete ventricosum]
MDAPPSAEVVAPPAAAVPDNRPSSPTARFPNPSSAPQKPEIHGNAEGPTGVVGQKETAPTAVEAAVVAGQSNSDASEAAPVTDLQKKLRRAERFGTPVMLSEEEKRNSRAERSEATPVEETRSFKSPLLSCLPVQGSIRLWLLLAQISVLVVAILLFGTTSTFDGGKIGGPLEEQKRKARAERCLLLLTQQICPCALTRPRSSRRRGSEVALGGESSWVRLARLIFAISFPPENTFSRFPIRVLKMRSCAEPSGCSEVKLRAGARVMIRPSRSSGTDPTKHELIRPRGSSGDGLAGSYTRELIRASRDLGDDSTEHELIRPSGGWGNSLIERELGKCPGAEEDVSPVFHRSRSMKDLFKTMVYKDDACYYALHMLDLAHQDPEKEMQPRWEGLKNSTKVWNDPSVAEEFERGLLHPQLAWELYTLPSKVLLARAAKEMVLRLLKEARVKARKMDDELLQSVKALENARAELPRRTVDHYKESVGFKEGLKRMGWVTYEYDYRVTLAHFRSLHPDSEVEEDPFTIRPEDDSVPMERQQAFDDSAPPKP